FRFVKDQLSAFCNLNGCGSFRGLRIETNAVKNTQQQGQKGFNFYRFSTHSGVFYSRKGQNDTFSG
ncbi:MAG: hypothetical protein KDC61_18455, partial [Saprospiraceae bacterium]|nr:hypothetical protein [Saprospiraceae bacterium]